MSLLSYISTAKTVCNACCMAIPQFTLVPYDIDKITLGMRGPLFYLTIWDILTCRRFTVKIIRTDRYANRFLNWRPDIVSNDNFIRPSSKAVFLMLVGCLLFLQFLFCFVLAFCCKVLVYNP